MPRLRASPRKPKIHTSGRAPAKKITATRIPTRKAAVQAVPATRLAMRGLLAPMERATMAVAPTPRPEIIKPASHWRYIKVPTAAAEAAWASSFNPVCPATIVSVNPMAA